MSRTIKFIANAVLWFDKINGNTYHSVRITRVQDGKIIYCPFEYGYGEQFKYTAFRAMIKNRWINPKYNDKPYMYERENNYPIYWDENQGTKKECINNGKE